MAEASLPLWLEAKGVIKKDVKKKLLGASRDVPIPDFCYDFLPITVQLEKDAPLGMCMKMDTVVSVRTTSPFQGTIYAGDIVTHVNKLLAPIDHPKIAEAIQKSAKGKVELIIARLRRHITIKPDPKLYQLQEGYDYEYKVMYFMRGMSLGLDIRDIDGKVYVAAVMPDSIAAMSLFPGECIIEVETEKTANVAQCSRVMADSLKKKGYCRVTIEIPNQDFIKNSTRMKINALLSESLPVDYESPAELRPIAEKGLAALADKTEVKPILLESDSKQTQHVSFTDTVHEHTIIMDTPTRLLVLVPPLKKVEQTEPTMQTKDEKTKD